MSKQQPPSETISLPLGRLLLIGAGAILVMFIGMQLIPTVHDNPPVLSEPRWDSPQTRALAKRACFDCYSNETVWPWYSYVAPASWFVTHNVQEGRTRLNFSEWGAGGSGEGGADASEPIMNGSMPPADYVAQHPQANLTDAEKQQLINGLAASP